MIIGVIRVTGVIMVISILTYQSHISKIYSVRQGHTSIFTANAE